MPEIPDRFAGYTLHACPVLRYGGLTQMCPQCTRLMLAITCLHCATWCWSCPRCDVLATLCRPCARRALWEPLWAPT